MQIMDILGDKQAANLARAFDIAPERAEAALTALVPMLRDRIERNTLSRGGLADFVSVLGARDRSQYLNDPKALASPDAIADGNAILEEILGSKDMSRKVAARASRQSGLSEALLKSLLPAIAAMTVGGLAKGAGGALGQVMQRIGVTDGTASPLPIPGQAPARPPLPQGKSPLPIPGDDLPGLGRNRSSGGRNPLDDLSDILRRGGRGFPGGGDIQIPRPQRRREVQVPDAGDDGRTINFPSGGGGSLWEIVRSILGSVLGFQNKGFLSWLIQLIVFKWGIGFLRRILTRVLTGR